MATTNYTWNLPTVGGSEDTWGTQLNQNWSSLDTLLGGVTNTEFAILDGATISTTELNYLSGATGNIQSQIDSLVSSGGANDSTITIAGSSGLTGGGSFTLNQASAATITLSGVTQGQSTWEAGTSTTESVVSPAKVKAAIDALAGASGIGVGQSWSSYATGQNSVSGTNATGTPYMVVVFQFGNLPTVTVGGIQIQDTVANASGAVAFIVPNGISWSVSFGGTPGYVRILS